MFAVNRNLDQGVALIGHLRDFEDYWIMSHTILEHENLKAFNSFDHPDEVKPHTYSRIEVKNGQLEGVLPKASWNITLLE